MDFFVIPSVNFGLLYGFVIIEHGRRRIRHVAVTSNPTAEWTSQQLREVIEPEEIVANTEAVSLGDAPVVTSMSVIRIARLIVTSRLGFSVRTGAGAEQQRVPVVVAARWALRQCVGTASVISLAVQNGTP